MVLILQNSIINDKLKIASRAVASFNHRKTKKSAWLAKPHLLAGGIWSPTSSRAPNLRLIPISKVLPWLNEMSWIYITKWLRYRNEAVELYILWSNSLLNTRIFRVLSAESIHIELTACSPYKRFLSRSVVLYQFNIRCSWT